MGCVPLRAKILAVVIIILVLAGGGAAYQLRLFNRPPKAGFSYRTLSRTLNYILPTDEDTIIFVNTSTDPDGDTLTSSWFVNDTFQSRSTDFQAKLPVGMNTVRLIANDGRAQGSIEVRITVERSSIFPTKKLAIPIKGVNFRLTWNPSRQEIEECLDVIRRDLGCNGIKLIGAYEDAILDAAKIAIQQGFEEIILNPRFEWTSPRNESFHIEDHIKRIGPFALRANGLVSTNRTVILCVGDELTFSVRGISNASTYQERTSECGRAGWRNLAAKENSYLERIVREVRNGFAGKITYASAIAMRLYIDWGRLGFDIVAPHYYYEPRWRTESVMLRDLAELKRCGKPVYVSEFGCPSYSGAGWSPGDAWMRYINQTYSQEEQANSIAQSVEIFQKAQIQGLYLWSWVEPELDDAISYGIMRYRKNGPYDRKLGFYMYKSYVTTNPS